MRQLVRPLAVAVATLALASPAAAQLQPLPYDEGSVGLGLALRRLPVAGRVLCVTAHPDDEHNGVLVALSRGRGLRVGLLTLTRGDGGQNAIGPELFDALGVLRTGELQALHRYDGAEQYFSRAYEFGFSFNLDETFERWGREETLGDVVAVFRRFRPDIVLTLPLEGKGEHTHHLASARLAREAFRAAADPARFPEQIAAGLAPWQAQRLYQGGVGGGAAREGAQVRLALGSYDPLLGMSWQQFGGLERTLHRSQSASQLRPPPDPAAAATFALVDSDGPAPADASDLASGLDLSLRALARFAPEAARAAIAAQLGVAEDAANAALRGLDALRPELSLPALRRGKEALTLARTGLAIQELDERLAAQELAFDEALRRAHGLSVTLTPSDDLVVPGQRFKARLALVNAGPEGVNVEGLAVLVPPGWESASTGSVEPGPLGPGQTRSVDYELVASADATPSQPFWKRGASRDRNDIAPGADFALPWSPPPLTATLRYRSENVVATARASATKSYEGRRVGGERQHELQVVPAFTVRLTPDLTVFPAGVGSERELRATVTSYAPGGVRGRLRFAAPAGFAVEPAEAELEFSEENQERVVRARLRAGPGPRPKEAALRATLVSNEREYRLGDQRIAYDHVVERRLYRPAETRVLSLPVKLGAGLRVAYVPGVGDALPEALRQLGLTVDLLEGERLADADLDRYTTIVLGVRAYTDAGVRGQQARLMRFVERGGHLVVQYGRNEFNQAGEVTRAVMGTGAPRETAPASPFTPYPAVVTTARLTDERAPLVVLAPQHALFTSPNRIGAADWDGWVQERAIQLLEPRDPRYVELLSGADSFPENAGEKRGLLVEAQYGNGTWTYVGLVLFRELPAGVPGAYRLLANLVSRPRAVPAVKQPAR